MIACYITLMIAGKQYHCRSELAKVVGASGTLGGIPRIPQRGEQQRRQQRNDRNHHEELY
jgi:hypothetical protein